MPNQAPTRPSTTVSPTSPASATPVANLKTASQPTRPPATQSPSKQNPRPNDNESSAATAAAAATEAAKRKPCRGECVSGLFALFCDDQDSDAYCPGEASCCITGSESDTSSNEQSNAPPITRRPAPVTAAPTPSTAALPRCPGFCFLNIMAAFCKRPAVLIARTSNCAQGSVCCDNRRALTTQRPQTRAPPPPPTRRPTAAPTTAAPAPQRADDPREECPGSCIVSLLSFTCFRKFVLGWGNNYSSFVG